MSDKQLQEFPVQVCRAGFGFATIHVKAENEYEAQQQALDVAGNHEYSEKDAEYSLVNPVPNPADADKSIRVFAETSIVRQYVMTSTAVQGLEIVFTPSTFDRVAHLKSVLEANNMSELRFMKHAQGVGLAADDDGLGDDQDGDEDEGDEEDRLSVEQVELVIYTRDMVVLRGIADDIGEEIETAFLPMDKIRALMEEGVSEVFVSNSDPKEFADTVRPDAEGSRVLLSEGSEPEFESQTAPRQRG